VFGRGKLGALIACGELLLRGGYLLVLFVVGRHVRAMHMQGCLSRFLFRPPVVGGGFDQQQTNKNRIRRVLFNIPRIHA